MSVTCGFYNSSNGDRTYDAIQMSSIFDGIIKDGIFMSIGDQMVVKANSGLTVNVGTGRAWFNHTWTLNDAEYLVRWEAVGGEEHPVDLDGNDITPETVQDRIDAVILRIDSSIGVRNNVIGIKKGTPSTVDPQKPVMEHTDTLHEYALAYVHIKPGTTVINQADIENNVGKSDTPYITGLLETVNTDALTAQWGDQWVQFMNQINQWRTQFISSSNTWYNGFVFSSEEEWRNWFETETTEDEADWETWYRNRQAAFEAWFANIQDVLDENTAAKLQNEIDSIIPITTNEIDDIWKEVVGV